MNLMQCRRNSNQNKIKKEVLIPKSTWPIDLFIGCLLIRHLPEVADLDTAGAQLGEQLALSAEKTAQDFVGPLPPSIIDEPNFAETHGKEDIDIAALAEQVLESTAKKPLAATTVEPMATTLEDLNHSGELESPTVQRDDALKVSAVAEAEQLNPPENQPEPSVSESLEHTQAVELEQDTVVEQSTEEMLV